MIQKSVSYYTKSRLSFFYDFPKPVRDMKKEDSFTLKTRPSSNPAYPHY
jgi:hypothetical protein